ncbi:hypothetical protein N7414_27370 [Pseudomonas sp. GD04087]|uniref:hypothetical protein n=1 Tax=unclassified Pseudomonas TaxID=196821 RepID=UPI002448E72E|nr:MULTISPECIES: hypothetical protein [unclassified Pseudomonas]MDH0292858.1 hypothetical protein [Pseudomonas sp. GD04087]MDH1049488.1 hypothetical protein [Pseudomonas sp. GD03903]MDH2000018.1 hypothetical protein [Pseudomonas sp. GD03691]
MQRHAVVIPGGLAADKDGFPDTDETRVKITPYFFTAQDAEADSCAGISGEIPEKSTSFNCTGAQG